jgi:ethanolamine ammonia-lyase large subunit
MSHKPPSARQLNYLKALAVRTGQTFQWPQTSVHASREIRRLKSTRPSTELERAMERFGDIQAIEAAQDAVEVHGFEIVGYGSECTWSQRS